MSYFLFALILTNFFAWSFIALYFLKYLFKWLKCRKFRLGHNWTSCNVILLIHFFRLYKKSPIFFLFSICCYYIYLSITCFLADGISFSSNLVSFFDWIFWDYEMNVFRLDWEWASSLTVCFKGINSSLYLCSFVNTWNGFIFCPDFLSNKHFSISNIYW